MITYTIDWLSCTFDEVITHDQLPHRLNELWDIDGIEPCAPKNGYTYSVCNRAGMVLQSSDRADMGTNLLCTGSALSEGSELCPDFQSRLQWCLSYAKTVSRLDVALDCRPGGMVDELIAQCRAAKHITHAKTWSAIDGNQGGKTLYIGSRQSERMLRIYDKGAQMTHQPGTWDRVELEVKGDAAFRLARIMATHDHAAIIRSWVNDYCRFDNSAWKHLIGASDIRYEPSQRKVTDTRDWLFYTVAPVMAKLYKQGDTNLLNEFAVYLASLAYGWQSPS